MDILFLIGRILFGGFFFMSGLNGHFRGFAGAVGYAKSKGVPLPEVGVAVSGALIVLGGLWVMLGMYAQIGLWEIIAFLIPVTFMMHRYWEEKDPMAKAMQKIQFNKNMALLGATLMMLMLPMIWPYALNIGS